MFEDIKFCFLSEADSSSRIDLEETSGELQKNGKYSLLSIPQNPML